MDPSDGDVPGSAPAGYPAGFETDVVLTDGATASVRPIRPDDGPLIVDFHARQSPEKTTASAPSTSKCIRPLSPPK